MTGGLQLPTATPHKDGCRTAVQTGKVTTTEVCTAGTMSTVSVSKTVEHNRIHRIDYMTKYLKDIKHCRQLQLTWPHSSPLILIQYLLHWYFISVKHKALKIFVFNHHQSSEPYICTGLTGTGPCSAERWCTRTWSVYGWWSPPSSSLWITKYTFSSCLKCSSTNYHCHSVI